MAAKYEFTVDWFTPNLPNWHRYLRPLIASGPLHVLELGCFEGRASIWLLENLLTDPASRLTVVDTFEGSPEIATEAVEGLFDRFLYNVTQTGKLAQLDVMRMTTVRALSSLISAANGQPRFHLVYVDASHRAQDVLTDAVLAAEVLRPGGLLVFDDYRWGCPSMLDSPKIAIDAFIEIFQRSFEILHKDYQVFLRKR